MKKIKILYIITGLAIGGAETLLLSIIQKLNKEIFTITIISLYKDDAFFPEFKKTGASVYCLNYSKKWNFFIIFHLIQIIKKEKPDIIHTHLPHGTIWGRIAAFFTKVKCIFTTEHNMSVWKKKHLFFYFLYKITYRINTRIIAVSQAIKNKMITEFSIPEDKIVVIHNGIDIMKLRVKHERPNDLVAISHPIICTIGRLHRSKGHRYLIKAFNDVVNEFPSANLLIVGDGDQRKYLENIVTENGLCNSVHLVGTRTNISAILQLTDIYVFPSLEEGLGISLIEACAVGKPCIASNVGGIPEVIVSGESGFLVPPADSSALASKIILLLKDNVRAKNLARCALKVVKDKFNIDDKVKNLEELYMHSCY